MVRLALLFFFGGIYLICSGCYDLFIQAGTSRKPTTISVAELEKGLPANRHLVVTGGRPIRETAITFYKTKWGTKVSGSEILFIPIADASSAAAKGSTPSILLRMDEEQINAGGGGANLNFGAIEGVRTTSMDLEDKARRRLVDSYGQDAVDRMIILNYHGSVGMGLALGKVGGGVAIVAGMIGGVLFLRKPKQPTAPVASPGSVPPVIPTGSVR
jgi:hypothetical protein